jgi:hypothetical protein
VTVLDTTLPLRDQQDWLALLPPQPVVLSPMQVRLLLRVVLPQPLFDRAAVLDLIAYQQRHKRAAYRAHRIQRLLRLHQALASSTIPHPGPDPGPSPPLTTVLAAPHFAGSL